MNLTESQYRELYRRFPGIDSFLNRCSVVNEYRYLCDNEYILNDWQKGRLAELRGYEVDFNMSFKEIV